MSFDFQGMGVISYQLCDGAEARRQRRENVRLRQMVYGPLKLVECEIVKSYFLNGVVYVETEDSKKGNIEERLR